MEGSIKTTAFVVMFIAMAAAVFAKDHKVGGDSKWIRPTNRNLYSSWATGKTFRVGDVLEFDFQTGAHDVATVTKDAYDTCAKTNTINMITNGPANITLNNAGPQYFICTFGDHCSVGQKLFINVTAATGRGGGGRNATTPAPEPTGSTATTPSGTTAAPPPSAASSLSGAAATFFVAVMSSAVALLC